MVRRLVISRPAIIFCCINPFRIAAFFACTSHLSASRGYYLADFLCVMMRHNFLLSMVIRPRRPSTDWPNSNGAT